MHGGCQWIVWLHTLPASLTKKRECLLHLNTPLYTGVNKMNKTSGLVVNIVWCWTSAVPQQSRTHTQSYKYPKTHSHMYRHSVHSGATTHTRTHTHTHTHTHACINQRSNTWRCTDKVNRAHRKKIYQTHTCRATHTHTVVQSVEQACWVAVSTYSAAMATSSMAIDSAAKWVRVCERDNLV